MLEDRGRTNMHEVLAILDSLFESHMTSLPFQLACAFP